MDGIGWAASAMIASRTRLEIAAGNLANASSDGFRKHLARGVLTSAGAAVKAHSSGDQGAMRRTGRPFDLAIVGSGHFIVIDARGVRTQTRDGAFSRNRFGMLCDDAGRRLIGERGVVRVSDGGAVEPDGAIVKDGRVLNRLPLPQGSSVQAGFLESSNVNAIAEMVDLLGAQRSFESAQKVMTAIDIANQKASGELARLK